MCSDRKTVLNTFAEENGMAGNALEEGCLRHNFMVLYHAAHSKS